MIMYAFDVTPYLKYFYPYGLGCYNLWYQELQVNHDEMVTTRNNPNDNVPNFEAMINAAVANALPNLTPALRTQITNDIRNGARPSGGVGGDAIPHGIHTRLAAFKIEGDALSWWKAHLRTQVGGDVFADTCTWVAFREIFYNKYFLASEQQHYEREYGSICQLDRENSREYMERLRLPPVTSSYCMRAGIRISVIEMDQSVEYRGRQDRGYDSKRQDFRGQDQRSAGRNGNDRQGQGNYN
uniref:Zinc finger, CCHC-type, retrotransposon Gag domain protein n=1 Tax=Tanacetum cinerariifolium TaxID=118510 RepID=A0A699L2D1_TANCI|nr:zinc finger, CCHC-type, retrotransposon Gag domain protein [Tanacetum cinerariifolium]